MKIMDFNKYIKLLENDQSYELCLEAVKFNGLLLKYIHKPTEEICFEAVKKIVMH